MTECYNDYLYRKRIEKGMHRREVAKALGVSKFVYHRYERGYSAPSEEVIRKINALYGEGFHKHFEGELGYPSEFVDKDEPRFRERLKKAFSKVWVKILAVVLSIAGLLTIPAALLIDHYSNPATGHFYSATYEEVHECVVQLGRPYADPLGSFHMFSFSEEYGGENSDIHVSIRTTEKPESINSTQFVVVMRIFDSVEEGYFTKPLVTLRLEYNRGNEFVYTITDPYTGEYYIQTGHRLSKVDFVVETSKKYSLEKVEDDFAIIDSVHVETIGLVADYYFDSLIGEFILGGEESSIDFYKDILLVKQKGDSTVKAYKTAYSIVAFLGVPLGMLIASLTIFAFVFLREREEGIPVLVRGEEELPENKRLPLWMGASALRLIGGILLLFGSTYVLLSLANQFGAISFVLNQIDANMLTSLASNVFFLGVFLLYILGLSDDFFHPKRLYRRTIVFGAIALGISVVQTLFAYQMKSMENGFVNLLLSYMPSNIFMMIFAFHLCAMFLFATPYFIKGKGIRVWRALSLLPVLWSTGIFIADVVSRANTGEGIENLTYFLGLNRYPYAIATYCFLFGNFFLRRHYEKKYGSAYLRGDMYAFFKNLTLCVPALILGAIELGLAFVPAIRDMGFGNCYSLLLVAILMLLYRGHNEKHHLGAVIAARILYGLGLAITYALTIALALVYVLAF